MVFKIKCYCNKLEAFALYAMTGMITMIALVFVDIFIDVGLFLICYVLVFMGVGVVWIISFRDMERTRRRFVFGFKDEPMVSAQFVFCNICGAKEITIKTKDLQNMNGVKEGLEKMLVFLDNHELIHELLYRFDFDNEEYKHHAFVDKVDGALYKLLFPYEEGVHFENGNIRRDLPRVWFNCMEVPYDYVVITKLDLDTPDIRVFEWCEDLRNCMEVEV